MHKPAPNQNSRALAPLALIAMIAALALPSGALAQDPAGDQYAPTTPSGEGDVPTTPSGGGNPVPGALSGSGAPDTTTPTPAPETGNTTAPTTAAPADTSTSTSATGTAGGGNKAQRTVGKLAADAQQSRDATSSSDSQPTAELLRSESSSGSGMGIFLWIVLGTTLLWALASGVLNFRRRDASQHDGRQSA